MYNLHVIVLLLTSKSSFAARVNCGNNGLHWASSCSKCPYDSRGISYGSSWCHGDCKWQRGSCVSGQTRTSSNLVDVSKFNEGCGTTVGYNNDEIDYIIGGNEARPHRFPWTVLIQGGCASVFCGGTLITSKHVVTAFHCTVKNEYDRKPCDHSKGKTVAKLGVHNRKDRNYQTIPIVDIKIPEGYVPYSEHRSNSHDFAIAILQKDATFSRNIRPICLPIQGAEYSGQLAYAAGWGKYGYKSPLSDVLRYVQLWVARKTHIYYNYNMFGTKIKGRHGKLADACGGDSGGPLMIQDPLTGKYILIGSVQGGWPHCRGNMDANLDSTLGIWNKVSAHTNWIKDIVSQ